MDNDIPGDAPAPSTRVDVALGVVIRPAAPAGPGSAAGSEAIAGSAEALPEVLIARRRQQGHLAGYWELPGGKCEPDESPEQCLHRELREELGIQITPLRALNVLSHDYHDRRVRLHPFICQIRTGEPQPLAASELRWVCPRALSAYRLPEANEPLIEQLPAELARIGDQAAKDAMAW